MRRRGQAGFTLLEVLVATVLMAIIVIGTLSTLSTTTRNAAKLMDHDRAALFARRKLDEVLIDKKLPKVVMLEGGWDPVFTNGKQSGWRAQILPFEWPPDPTPGMMILERVQVEVWWTEQTGQRRTFQVEGFRRGMLTQRDMETGLLAQVPR
ncbi:MAG: prepilin-type N-terminal cleavage/methylation domain-containing protein [Bryobacteraceae bacterium]|nr:prepilin-type N-terminal cleavage/methylation domain-containing protein [Bryobacteraceae bacterium]